MLENVQSLSVYPTAKGVVASRAQASNAGTNLRGRMTLLYNVEL